MDVLVRGMCGGVCALTDGRRSGALSARSSALAAREAEPAVGLCLRFHFKQRQASLSTDHTPAPSRERFEPRL